MKDWKCLKLRDPILFYGKEFDGSFREEGYVERIFDDHIIVKANGMSLWLDDDTESLFFRLVKGDQRCCSDTLG